MKSLFIPLRLVRQYKLGPLRPRCRKGRNRWRCLAWSGPARPDPDGPGPVPSCDEPPNNLKATAGGSGGEPGWRSGMPVGVCSPGHPGR